MTQTAAGDADGLGWLGVADRDGREEAVEVALSDDVNRVAVGLDEGVWAAEELLGTVVGEGVVVGLAQAVGDRDGGGVGVRVGDGLALWRNGVGMDEDTFLNPEEDGVGDVDRVGLEVGLGVGVTHVVKVPLVPPPPAAASAHDVAVSPPPVSHGVHVRSTPEKAPVVVSHVRSVAFTRPANPGRHVYVHTPGEVCVEVAFGSAGGEQGRQKTVGPEKRPVVGEHDRVVAAPHEPGLHDHVQCRPAE